MRLTGVFDDCQVVFFSETQNRVHIGRLAVQMYRNDRRNCLPGPSANGIAGVLIDMAPRLQILPELFRIQAAGATIDVDKLN